MKNYKNASMKILWLYKLASQIMLTKLIYIAIYTCNLYCNFSEGLQVYWACSYSTHAKKMYLYSKIIASWLAATL